MPLIHIVIAFPNEPQPIHSEDPAYDDYFAPPEEMLSQVDNPTENYFENTG